MQNANTDATLVCHANKPYDECLWTTPYGKTYTFSDQKSSHEGGRIAYFGFADTDCGVIVRNVQPKDNGGWQCQLHSRNGDIFQNASDVVSLFAGNYKEWKLQIPFVCFLEELRISKSPFEINWPLVDGKRSK